MKKYEVMYIIRPTLDADATAATVKTLNEVFTNNGSKVLEVNEWGLRELAYDIEKNHKGYYVVLTVEATVEAVNEFNRVVGYNENILRHIVVNAQE